MRTHLLLLTTALVAVLAAPAARAAATDPDLSFDADGRTQDYLDLGSSKADLLADAALASTTGSLYAVGKVETGAVGGPTFGVLFKRLLNGTRDNAFSNGSSGPSRVYFGAELNGGSSGLTGVAFDSSNTGAVAVVGFNDLSNGQRCGVAYKVLDNAVVRGALDGGFAYQGRFTYCSGIGAETTFSDVKVLPDGRWLISGNSSFASGEKNGFLLRLGTNGQLDPSFNSGGSSGAPGLVVLDIRTGKNDSALRIAATSSGYYVAGNSLYYDNPDAVFGDDIDLWVARLNVNGTFDQSFGSAGKRIEVIDYPNSDKTDLLADLTIDNAGRVLLLGNINPRQLTLSPSTYTSDPARYFHSRLAVIRLLGNGQRDASFASNGLLQTIFGESECGANTEYCSFNEPAALVVTPASEVWIAGRHVPAVAGGGAPSNFQLALGRISAAGVLALSQRQLYGNSVQGVSLLRQADGKLVIGAQLRTTALVSDQDVSLLRLSGTP